MGSAASVGMMSKSEGEEEDERKAEGEEKNPHTGRKRSRISLDSENGKAGRDTEGKEDGTKSTGANQQEIERTKPWFDASGLFNSVLGPSKQTSPVPELPTLVSVSDSSLTITWEMEPPTPGSYEKLEGQSATFMSRIFGLGSQDAKTAANTECNANEETKEEHWEYEVQYRPERSTYVYPIWSKVPPTRNTHLVLTDLHPKTVYSIRIRSRHVTSATLTEKNMPTNSNTTSSSQTSVGGWGQFSETARFATRGRIQQEVTEGQERVKLFFEGKLRPYPEDKYQDTTIDKAGRVGLGIMHTLDFMGFGGAYVKTAKLIYKARHGLGALLLAPDVEDAVTNLSRLLSEARAQLNFSVQDAVFGSYYIMAIRRGTRRRNPDYEADEHTDGVRGVLKSRCPDEILNEMRTRVAMAWFAYAPTSPALQWMCRRYPRPGDPFEVIISSPTAVRISKALVKPAYALLAHRRQKRLVLTLRGTNSFEDVIVDARHAPVPFSISRNSGVQREGEEEKEDTWGYCHEGMLRAAEWLLRSPLTQDPKNIESELSQMEISNQKDSSNGIAEIRETVRKAKAVVLGGGGLGRIIDRFHEAGYTIELVGHSLGAGVATLVGLLLKSRRRSLGVNVYAYAPPACVCSRLARRCCPMTTKIESKEGSSPVRVWSMVLSDDPVPRASAENILDLAREIVGRKSQWKTALQRELDDLKHRALGLWAPMTRATHWDRMSREGYQYQGMNDQSITKKTCKSDREKSNNEKLFPPGAIVHVYSHNGCRAASLVDHTWSGFQRVEVSRHMFRDHSKEGIMSALRDVAFARKASHRPPKWAPAPPSGPVLCAVCGYSVAWASSSDNQLEQSRELRHCYSCGRIVCPGCSSNRMALPGIGIPTPVRVCEHCYLNSCCNP